MEDEKQPPIENQQYKQPVQQQQQPVQQQYYKSDKSKQTNTRLVQVGIILIMIGIIITIGVQGFAEAPSSSYYDIFPTQDEWVQYTVAVSGIIYYIGLTMTLLGLFGLALLTKEMHVNMKIALIISFALVFGFGLNGGLMFMMSPFLF